MIKTVEDLRAKFPANANFAFYKNGLPIAVPGGKEKISEWIVSGSFTVVVILQ